MSAVLRAPSDGTFREVASIRDHVEAGQAVAYVDDAPVSPHPHRHATRHACWRERTLPKGLKCGDIDPRDEVSHCETVSDKGLAVAGGVLEAILHLSDTFTKA